MNPPTANSVEGKLSLARISTYVAGAIIAFHLAYCFHAVCFLMAVYLWCLSQLTRLSTSRQAFYTGLLVGMLAYGPQMNFLWTIFGPAAIALWAVLSFWLGMFLVLGRACRIELSRIYAALLIPFLWTGLEYFRSELYYLRFSWFNAGYAFSDNLAWLPLGQIGVYGIGFGLMAVISLCSLLPRKRQFILLTTLVAGLGVLANALLPTIPSKTESSARVQVAGVQLEFPPDAQVIYCLNKLVKKYPEAQLLVLSEYTFNGPVPESIMAWCKKSGRYLVVGAKDTVSGSDYYDSAFVIGPSGEIVFRQAKSVPIQFFKDGLPANEQKIWESPWGKIGFCICYDLSYSRVTDRLVRLGAQAIIVPTMDIVEWGRHQHELHARVAPIRAAEYGVPIFRLASSGISQYVDSTGQVQATAPMPGDEATLSGTLRLARPGTLPWDRIVAPLSAGITGLTMAWLLCISLWRKRRSTITSNPP